jgi:hypothetical protein
MAYVSLAYGNMRFRLLQMPLQRLPLASFPPEGAGRSMIASSLAALAGALVLVVSPISAPLGFVPVSSGLAITIVVIVPTYLACAEIAKRVADRPVR